MTEGEKLLAAVLADPGAEHLRLIYADFLEEQGDRPSESLGRRLREPGRFETTEGSGWSHVRWRLLFDGGRMGPRLLLWSGPAVPSGKVTMDGPFHPWQTCAACGDWPTLLREGPCTSYYPGFGWLCPRCQPKP